MKNRVKAILGGTSAAAIIGAGALFAAPAQAAPVITEDKDPVTGAITQTATVKDGGGVDHTFTVIWVKKYRDPAGALRVSVPTLIDKRTDADTEDAGEPADAGEDVHFDVSSHGTVRWTQHVNLDNVDLDEATDDQVTFNPRNPISDAGDTFIRIRAGVDGDGQPSSEFVYFVQPAGVGVVG